MLPDLSVKLKTKELRAASLARSNNSARNKVQTTTWPFRKMEN